ncbi:MAG TPA: hypothetical protein VL742_15950, partial [Casimicrobiaceae bacterium]|nr:hypothetical protein [Casimicrobiaceae bacterium]
MKLNSLLISAVLCFCSLQVMSVTYAQGQATGGSEKTKAVLLRAAGWKADWSRGADKGVSEIVFEARGNKV